MIEDLERQRSRTVRSIVLEHEKRDFVESWRAFRQFSLAMYELVHAAGATAEAERSLAVRLVALEQQGIVPSYDHSGLAQHFDLEWRRARTYPARTRASAPADEAPAYGLSRTRCRMIRKGKGSAPAVDPGMELGVVGLTHGPETDPETFIDDSDDDLIHDPDTLLMPSSMISLP